MHEIIFSSTEKMLKDYCTQETIEEMEQGIFPHKLWSVVEELGLASIALPESHGGVGGDYLDAYQVVRLFGKYAAPIPFVETVLSKWLLAEYNFSNIQNEIYTISLNKPHSLIVKEEGKRLVISGTIKNVPWARVATNIVVCATKNNQTVLGVIPKKDATIECGKNIAGEYSEDVMFDGVEVKHSYFREIDYPILLEKMMQLGALATSAKMIGAMETIMQMCLQYVKEREQFGRPIYKFQAIQHQLANLSGYVLSATTIVNTAINLLNKKPENIKFELASTKLRVNKLSYQVSELAHQIHGAIGVTYEHKLHQYTRRLWAWREQYGNEAYWEGKLSQQISEYTQDIWSFMTMEG